MKKIFLALFATFVTTLTASAQGARNIKINEVMTNNTASIVDEYGRYNPWIELSNIAYSSYNVRGMYVTTDRRVLDKKLTVPQRVAMMSIIPSGDDRTQMSARKRLILYLNGNPAEGTQHLTAPAKAGQPVWIAIYDGNAVDLIDSVTVPALAPNLSYARVKDGSAKWEVKTAEEVTPGSNNFIHQGESKVARLKRDDPHGFGISILSMGIVFFCLALLYVFFRILGIFMARKQALKKAKNIPPVNVAVKVGEKLAETGHKTNVILKDGMKSKGIDKEVYIAVISMALKQYSDDVHDIESNIITIKPRNTMWNARFDQK
jgi:Na+-transporting methylmalonyl-CoA/oxaloacetate decarboxylase gamma subunit